MIRPPSPLVSSGRRRYAGPGQPVLCRQPLATLSVIVLAAILISAPPLLAVISSVFSSRLEGFGFQSVLPLQVGPMVESGRVLLTLALVTHVVRTKESA